MFYDCAKLNSVKCLATDITAENSTKDWLGKAGTEATGEKVLVSVVPMTPNSDDGVPASWTTAGWAANEYNEGKWENNELTFTKQTAASDPTAVANSDADVTWDKGWYTVSGNVTITGNVKLTADAHLILCDGAQLTINGQLNGNSDDGYNLYIYGQKKGDGKLNVSCSDVAIFGPLTSGKTIEIHGGEITATSTGIAGFVSYGIKMYGGKLTATGNGPYPAAAGIAFAEGNFDVYGGEVEAINTGNVGAFGIMGGDGGDILTVYGGTVKATGGNGDYSQAISANIKSGTTGIKFYFSDDGTTWGDGAYYEDATRVGNDAATSKRYFKAEKK